MVTSPLDWKILEALDDSRWTAGFHERLRGWPDLRHWEWMGARDERGFGRVRLPVETGGVAHPHRVCWLERYRVVHAGQVLHPIEVRGCPGRPCAHPECWMEGPVGTLPKSLPTGRRIHGKQVIHNVQTGITPCPAPATDRT